MVDPGVGGRRDASWCRPTAASSARTTDFSPWWQRARPRRRLRIAWRPPADVVLPRSLDSLRRSPQRRPGCQGVGLHGRRRPTFSSGMKNLPVSSTSITTATRSPASEIQDRLAPARGRQDARVRAHFRGCSRPFGTRTAWDRGDRRAAQQRREAVAPRIVPSRMGER